MLKRTVSWLCAGVLANSTAADPDRSVRVERVGDQWVLTVGGEPSFIKGGGGDAHLGVLAALGGNSIRTWGADQLEPRDWPDGTHRSLMDIAAQHGLTVCVGFWVEHPRHGFDYDDEPAVLAQLERARAFAEQWKDHPALLMWGVGNEVTLGADQNRALREVNRVARVFREVDPHHPTMTAIPGVWNGLAAAFREHCPDVDILGVNVYGGLNAVPQELTRQGYDGPYVVTEFGPIGHWETATTPWGAPIEQSSAGKARTARELYSIGILAQRDRCLGSYAFLWGQKQERTETWYGLFLKTGERTPTTDVLSWHWTGRWPEHRAPLVEGIACEAALRAVAPGAEFDASVLLDPAPTSWERLSVEWRVLEESTATSTGGDREAEPSEVPGAVTLPDQPHAKLRAPERPGAYRLFVIVRDDHGGAGAANIPFLVR